MKIESGTGLTLNGAYLRNTTEEKTSEPLQSSLTDPLAGHEVREDLMEGSFMDLGSGPSRYIEATMIGLQVNNEFKNKMGGILESYKLQAQSTDSYAEKNLIGQKAANAVGDMVEGEVSETEAERMEKEREEFEEKIEEKLEEKISGEDGTAEEAGKTTAASAGPKATEPVQAADSEQQDGSAAAQAAEDGAATIENANLDLII